MKIEVSEQQIDKFAEEMAKKELLHIMIFSFIAFIIGFLTGIFK